MIQIEGAGDKNFAIDTTFVLFFLAVDFGTTLLSFGIDSLFSGLTLSILAVLPFFYIRPALNLNLQGGFLGG